MLVYNQGQPEEGVYTLFVQVCTDVFVLLLCALFIVNATEEPSCVFYFGTDSLPLLRLISYNQYPRRPWSLPVHVVCSRRVTVGFGVFDSFLPLQ